ncbi:MAG: hypothetical protein ACI8YD_003233, partial [Rheinheimera aquimaris]
SIAEGNFDGFPAKLVHALHLTLSELFARLEKTPELDEGIEEFLH